MASLIVTCSVVCCDALLQLVLTTATEDVNLRIVTFEMFDKVKWVVFCIGFFWAVMVVDTAVHITRTFVMTLPLFTTIAIFTFFQGAVFAHQNLLTLRSALKTNALAPLPNSSHNLSFSFEGRNSVIAFKSNKQELQVWMTRSPGLIPVSPIKQKSGALEFRLPKGKVLVHPPHVKIFASRL